MPITFGSTFSIRKSLVNVKSVPGVAVFFLSYFVDTHNKLFT